MALLPVLSLADVICAESHRANLKPYWVAVERYLNSLSLHVLLIFLFSVLSRWVVLEEALAASEECYP
jgi:hypothetical protein